MESEPKGKKRTVLVVRRKELKGVRRDDEGKVIQRTVLGPSEYYEKAHQGIFTDDDEDSGPKLRLSSSWASPLKTLGSLSEEPQKEDDYFSALEKVRSLQNVSERKEGKALKRWRETTSDWDRLSVGLSRVVKRKPEELIMMSSCDNYREQSELYGLMQAVVPQQERHSEHYWEMSLRGHGNRSVRVGNIFSGLFCPIKTETKLPPIIRSVATATKKIKCSDQQQPHRKKSWRDDPYLKARQRQCKSALGSPRLEDASDLAIIGQDLFDWALHSSQAFCTAVQDLTTPIDMSLETQHDIDAKKKKKQRHSLLLSKQQEHNNKQKDTVQQGSTGSVVLLAAPDNAAQHLTMHMSIQGAPSVAEVKIENRGMAAAYYEWRRLPTAGRLDPQAATLSESAFLCLKPRGCLLPGQRAATAFGFVSRKPGHLTSEWQLIVAGSQTSAKLLVLHGVTLPQDDQAHLERNIITTPTTIEIPRIRTPEDRAAMQQQLERDAFCTHNPFLIYTPERYEKFREFHARLAALTETDRKHEHWNSDVGTIRSLLTDKTQGDAQVLDNLILESSLPTSYDEAQVMSPRALRIALNREPIDEDRIEVEAILREALDTVFPAEAVESSPAPEVIKAEPNPRAERLARLAVVRPDDTAGKVVLFQTDLRGLKPSDIEAWLEDEEEAAYLEVGTRLSEVARSLKFLWHEVKKPRAVILLTEFGEHSTASLVPALKRFISNDFAPKFVGSIPRLAEALDEERTVQTIPLFVLEGADSMYKICPPEYHLAVTASPFPISETVALPSFAKYEKREAQRAIEAAMLAVNVGHRLKQLERIGVVVVDALGAKAIDYLDQVHWFVGLTVHGHLNAAKALLSPCPKVAVIGDERHETKGHISPMRARLLDSLIDLGCPDIILAGDLATQCLSALADTSENETLFIRRLMSRALRSGIALHLPTDYVSGDTSVDESGMIVPLSSEHISEAEDDVDDDESGTDSAEDSDSIASDESEEEEEEEEEEVIGFPYEGETSISASDGYDLGPETRNKFAALLTEADSILWSGVLGLVECQAFQTGTRDLAEVCLKRKSLFVSGQSATHWLGALSGQVLANGKGATHVSSDDTLIHLLCSGTPFKALERITERTPFDNELLLDAELRAIEEEELERKRKAEEEEEALRREKEEKDDDESSTASSLVSDDEDDE